MTSLNLILNRMNELVFELTINEYQNKNYDLSIKKKNLNFPLQSATA